MIFAHAAKMQYLIDGELLIIEFDGACYIIMQIIENAHYRFIVAIVSEGVF